MEGDGHIWYWGILFVVLFLCIIIPRQNKILLGMIQRKRKGKIRKMPTELIKEFIGKVCSISLFNESFGITGKIVALEDNWIKIEEKDTVRLVNGDMIRDIKLMPAKYQK